MIAAAPAAMPAWNGLLQLSVVGTDPSIGLIKFNDPARSNAMTEGMASDFCTAVRKLEEIAPRAIVVTGNGKAFSAGGDMEMIKRKQRQSAERNASEMHAFYHSFLSILQLKTPIVAAINGAAIGAGLCFACACDRRIAADTDSKNLGFSFAKLGLAPGMGGTIFPRRLVGEERANDMLEKAYNVTPREALAMGMIEMIVPPESLMEHAMDAAGKLALDRKKVISKRVNTFTLRDALAEEAMLQGASFLTPQHKQLYKIFIQQLRKKGS